MKSLMIKSFGGTDVLEFFEVPIPKAQGHEVLIKIAFAGVNPLDWKIRSGSMKMVTGKNFPMSLGSEFSGEIIGIGKKVTHFEVGQRVVGSAGIKGGAYGEFALVHQDHVSVIREGVSMRDASCSVVAGLTAYQCLVHKGRIQKGHKLLINGVSGGVGSLAVQIAALWECDIQGVCSGKNVEYAKELGCNEVTDYLKESPLDTNKKYDLVFDVSNSLDYADVKSILTEKGVYVNTLPGAKVFLAQIFTSVFTKKKCKTYLMKFNREEMNWILNKVATGKVRIPLTETYKFENVKEAIERIESGGVPGKIAVEIDGSIN
nr:NAD(P)-dependent alcohol dehydrogenase [Saprospiraceae bacterium]